MTLFSPDQLEEALSREEISSWERTKYLILFLVLHAASTVVPGVLPTVIRQPDLHSSGALAAVFTLALVIFLVYWGIRKCFLINQAADDHDFAGRFLVLYIPALVEVLVITLFSIVLISFIAVLLSFPDKTPQPWFSYAKCLLAPVMTYLLFTVLARSFRRLAVLIEKNKEVLIG
jgi:hypothetical protein